MQHHKFPSIEQFKNAVKYVQKYLMRDGVDSIAPIKYSGSVKIHGTNAAVCRDETGHIYFQSRERILDIGSDNAGFCMWGEQNKAFWKENLDRVSIIGSVSIYGEWAGPGINSGVGVNELPHKIFYIFAINKGGVWLSRADIEKLQEKEDCKVLTRVAKPYSITIDYKNPASHTEEIERMVTIVADACPVAQYHGISGIGEGIVFIPENDTQKQQTDLWFKAKDARHSMSKTTTGAKTSAVDLTGYAEAVNTFVTEARLQRGMEFLKESGKDFIIQNTPDFLRFIVNDVMREEREEIIKNGFEAKRLNGMVSAKAREFYIKKIDSLPS